MIRATEKFCTDRTHTHNCAAVRNSSANKAALICISIAILFDVMILLIIRLLLNNIVIM